MKLLNSCPRLTHLSLTGVAAFQRDDFQPFCRTPPPGMFPRYSFTGMPLTGVQSSRSISETYSASFLVKWCPVSETFLTLRPSSTSYESHTSGKWARGGHPPQTRSLPNLWLPWMARDSMRRWRTRKTTLKASTVPTWWWTHPRTTETVRWRLTSSDKESLSLLLRHFVHKHLAATRM